jgi:hypothetical protein
VSTRKSLKILGFILRLFSWLVPSSAARKLPRCEPKNSKPAPRCRRDIEVLLHHRAGAADLVTDHGADLRQQAPDV